MTKSESRVCDLFLLHRFRIPLALPSGPWTCRHTPATLSQASKSTMAKGRVLRGRIDTSQESWLLTPDLLQRFSRRESQSIVIRWGLESLMTRVISFKMTHIEEKSFSIGRDKLKWNNDSSPKSLMRTALKRFTFVMRASYVRRVYSLACSPALLFYRAVKVGIFQFHLSENGEDAPVEAQAAHLAHPCGRAHCHTRRRRGALWYCHSLLILSDLVFIYI